jgi:glycosyltransferase involved in cell wall biosynthesis
MVSATTGRKYFGVIDEDPFHFQTWSGSSRYFFGAFRARGQLAGATGTEPPRVTDTLLRVANFHPSRSSWRFAYHLDPKLFRARTKVAEKAIRNLGETVHSILQVGAWYDMTDLGMPAISYHDGNLARRLASPYGHPAISRSRLDAALKYERDLYHRLALIFPMSEWLARSFEKDFGVSRNKIEVVYAGVNLPEIQSFEPADYLGKNILFVGKDFGRKGGHDLLEAFKKIRKKVPDVILTIVGPTEPIEGEAIRYFGPISKATEEGVRRLRDIYRSATVFVMPTLYEPFGIVFAEAMAHGLPCVGTRVCAVPEIIRENMTGLLVEPNSPDDICDAVCNLLSDPTMCAGMGKDGFERYSRDFRWSKVAEKIDGRFAEDLCIS